MNTESKIEGRLQFLQLDDASVAALERAKGLLDPKLEGLIDDFYRHVLTFPATHRLFPDGTSVERARAAQIEHWRDLLFGGIPGENYYGRARRIGLAHEAIGLTMSPYLAGYCFVLNHFAEVLAETADPATMASTLQALQKAAFFDIDCVTESYLESKNKALRRILEHTEQFANSVEPLEEEAASQCHHLAQHCAKVAEDLRDLQHRIDTAESRPDAGGSELREFARHGLEQVEALARRSSQLAERLDHITETARARRDAHKLHFIGHPKLGPAGRFIERLRDLFR
jgi:truncated hemoglobin YjbI